MSTPPTTDWLSLARDAYSASNTFFDASIRSSIEADLRQFQGQHPSGSKYLAEANRGRSKLFRPKTRVVIRKNEALAAEAFFSTTDVVSVTPEDDNDPERLASAAVMQALLQYRLTKTIPWFLTVIGAYQDAQTVGVVASYQYWEYSEAKKKDQPAIRLIPVENLRFDAGANWTDPVNTSPYVIELIPMYVKDVRARMRRPDPKTGEPKWLLLEDSVIMQATRQYGDSIRQQREGQRTDSKTQSQANSSFNIVWVHKNLIEVDEVDYCYYTLGTEQLLSKPVPLSELYFHGRRPYVLGFAVIETHKTYPSSVPHLTRDVQAEINEIANQRIDNVKLVLNKRYFAKRNRQVDLRSITRNVPGSVTLMQDTDDVKPVEFNDVTGSSYKEQEVLNLDFDDMAGAFSGSSVQSNRKMNETVGGMQLLNSGANQVSGYQLRTFVETWVEPVLRQIVLLEQHYETNEVLVALCNKAAAIHKKFGVDAITDEQLMGEFVLNVNVGLGATNPLQQVEQFQKAMGALREIVADGVLLRYGLKVDEVIKELFGKLGYRDGGRFFSVEDQDPVITELQAKVQELQQALDAKLDPRMLDATIRRIEAEIVSMGVKDKKEGALTVKAGVDTEFAAMQAAEVVATIPQVAPIADELMKAAGYQPPNPAGVDPNFPQPPAAAPGAMLQQAAMDPGSFLPTAPGDTSPGTPANTMQAMPESAGTGVRAGIETMRPDSVGVPGFDDGGLVDDFVSPVDGMTEAQSDGVDDLVERGVRPGQRSVTMPAGLSPSQQGGALMDMLHAAPSGSNPVQLNALRDAAQATANPNWPADGGRTRVGIKLSDYGTGYNDGGVIQGPGTGISDSIAAVNTHTGQPLAVSDGEYQIPPEVVAALGEDFFDKLLEKFHTPAPDGQRIEPAPDASPLPMAPGTFIIPADVVQALGADFFDQLIEQFGTPAA